MCNPTKDGGSSPTGLVRNEKRAYFQRYWTWADVARALTVTIVHFWCLLAPFNYTWEALRFGLILVTVTNLLITFSYHRNLAHRSFKLPKWLEYPIAYAAVFALQVKTGLLFIYFCQPKLVYGFQLTRRIIYVICFWKCD